MLQHNIQATTHCLSRLDRMIIDPERKQWWLLYTCTSGEGRSLVLWECETVKPAPLGVWQVQGFGFFFFLLWISSGTLDRISRPMIPRAVPCWPGWRLPFVSKPLLTSTSYCHVVSWASCQGEHSPSSQTTTGLITGTICTPGSITRKLVPEEMFGVMVAEINLYVTNTFKRGFIKQPISEEGLLFRVFIVLKAWTLGWPFSG